MAADPFFIFQNVQLRSVPIELAAGLVLGDACFEEVLLFGQVHCLAHPWEWIVAVVLNWQADTLQPAISNVLDVVAEQVCVEPQRTVKGEDRKRCQRRS